MNKTCDDRLSGIMPEHAWGPLADKHVGKTCSRVCPTCFFRAQLLSLIRDDKGLSFCTCLAYSVFVDLLICISDRYSLLQAKEVEGMRFVQLRNPWGHDEWGGPWSDRSDEWKANPKIQKGLKAREWGNAVSVLLQ